MPPHSPRAPGQGTVRIVCLEVLLFPLAARLRSEPELRQEAVAVLDGNGAQARVVAASRRARRAGVRPGQTLTQARSLLPRLIARARDPSCERAAQEALLDVAEGISPRVEDAGDGRIYLDATGLMRHYPDSEDPEHALAATLLDEVEKRAGLMACAGMAGSKLAARVAAGMHGGPTIVPHGCEAAFLAPLPLHRLLLAGGLLNTLERWGIHSAGALARLPANAITSRLGEAGRRLHTLARGLDPQPLVPRQPAPTLAEGMELEWPLVDLEAFGFVARAALERLATRMAAQGLGCLRLDLSLQLEPDGHHERSLTLPAPTREVKTLLSLLRLDLERCRPGAPVRAFTFTIHPDAPRAAQRTLFGPDALSPERLATTLARLFARLGENRAGAPATVDAHPPERFALVPYTPPPPPTTRREPPTGRGLLAIRVLRPAIALAVTTHQHPEGEDPSAARPRHIETAECDREGTEHTGHTGRRPRIAGTVRVAAGPWQLEAGWWRAPPIRRSYWDIELEGGGLYRIYRDRIQDGWFADGIYD